MRVFGFDVHEKAEPPSSETLAGLWRPYIETCIAAFGPERAMFESNFPVDKGSGSYQVFWNAFKRIAAGCSAGGKDGAVFRHGVSGFTGWRCDPAVRRSFCCRCAGGSRRRAGGGRRPPA